MHVILNDPADEHGRYHDARMVAERCSYGITETPAFIILCVSYNSCHVQKTVSRGPITSKHTRIVI